VLALGATMGEHGLLVLTLLDEVLVLVRKNPILETIRRLADLASDRVLEPANNFDRFATVT
jgi:hypothetical protein